MSNVKAPTLVIHGNPTSSYLWRNVMPHLESLGRCIAPDLIGMGDSEKLPVAQGWPESARGIFQGFRSEKGEDLILNRNMFVEKVLPASVIRTLTEEEMEEYRRPFTQPEDRQPTLNWPRALPIEGEPVDMVKLVKDYGDWLSHSDLPKLFINAEPGSILVGKAREFCRRWPNQTEVTVKGLHFIQEDSPDEIGEAIAGFVQSTGQ